MAELRMDEQAEMDDDADDFPDSLTRDFAMAMDAAWLKTKDSPFADVVREYKAVESIFTARAADNEEYVLGMRRGVAEAIFKEAVLHQQSFDTCMARWEDVVRLGISEIQTRSTMTWYYAECCRRNKRTEMGLEMLEPHIAELQRLLADPNVEEGWAGYYRQELDIMGKLLAKLQAQRLAPST
jgi:hypothetical protein